MFPSEGNWHPTQALMDESQFTLNQTAFTSMSVLQSAPPRVLIVQNSWEIKTCSPDRPHTEVLTRVLASFSSRPQTRTPFGSTIRITIIPTQNGTLFSQNKCRICFFRLSFSYSSVLVVGVDSQMPHLLRMLLCYPQMNLTTSWQSS